MVRRRIARSEAISAGYRVTVEVEGAYTDGSSRFDTVEVPAAVAQLPEEDRLAAVLTALDVDPFEALTDVDLDAWDRLRRAGDRLALTKARTALRESPPRQR